MKERPISFSGPMVCAILEGRKTQTRRVLKPQPVKRGMRLVWENIKTFLSVPFGETKGFLDSMVRYSPYGHTGDRLWVRESFAVVPWVTSDGADEERVIYEADNPGTDIFDPYCGDKWSPVIFMPRRVSRIILEITEVRVERLQEISEDDAVAEGITRPSCIGLSACGGGCDACEAGASYTAHFCNLWESLNVRRPGCAWSDNPWVWVISFKRVFPDIAMEIDEENLKAETRLSEDRR